MGGIASFWMSIERDDELRSACDDWIFLVIVVLAVSRGLLVRTGGGYLNLFRIVMNTSTYFRV